MTLATTGSATFSGEDGDVPLLLPALKRFDPCRITKDGMQQMSDGMMTARMMARMTAEEQETWQGEHEERRAMVRVREQEKREKRNERQRVKNAEFRTDHSAEHQENLVAINTSNRLTGGRNDQRRVKYADFKTDQPAEHQKNRDAINTKNNLAGGKNDKLRAFKTNALPEPSSKCRSYPYGPLAKASIVAYYTKKDKLKLPQIDQILGRFSPQPLLHGLYHKYGGDAALCNLREAIKADENSRLLDAIAASGLPLSAHPPAGKRMRVS
jgi:hypothetical protein